MEVLQQYCGKLRPRHQKFLNFIILFLDVAILGSVFLLFTLYYYSPSAAHNGSFEDTSLPPENWLIPNDVVFAMAFYPLGKSKHSLAEYTRWTENLFSILQCRVVLFTVPSSEAFYSRIYLKYKDIFPDRSITYIRTKADLLKHQGTVETTMVIVSMYHHVYDLPPIIPYVDEIKYKQHALDPSTINSEQLYAVWSSKVWFLHESMSFFKQPALLHFWMDIGNRRYIQAKIRYWPNMKRLSELVGGKALSILEDKIINAMVNKPKFTKKAQAARGDIVFSYAVTQRDTTVAFFFGGSKRAIQDYHDKYYEKIAEWSRNKMFWGVEQIVMDALAFHNRDKIMVIDNSEICNSAWQYKYYSFLYSFLADDNEKTRAKHTSAPLKLFSDFVKDELSEEN